MREQWASVKISYDAEKGEKAEDEVGQTHNDDRSCIKSKLFVNTSPSSEVSGSKLYTVDTLSMHIALI